MAILLFTKWRPTAILDFVTGQKWLNCRLQTVHVYHQVKFGNNSSNGGRVIAIFLFFKMAAGRHLGFGPTDLQDHPRWRVGGLKCPVKFRIDLTYSFEDIEIA